MGNYFAKAANDKGTTGHEKLPEPQIENPSSENPTLNRIMRKRVQKPAMKTYSFYLKVELAEKLAEVAEKQDVSVSNILNDILTDVLENR